MKKADIIEALSREKRHGYHPKRGGYLSRMLLDDEFIVNISRPHWSIYWSGMFLIALGYLTGVFGNPLAVAMIGTEAARFTELPVFIISGFCLVIGALYLFFIFLRDISSELVVTNERVIYKHGFFAPSVFQATVTKVASVDIVETLIGRLFDYGTVAIKASGQHLDPIDHVADPFRFYFYVMREARLETHPDKAETLQVEIISPERLPPAFTKRLPGPQSGENNSLRTGGAPGEDEDEEYKKKLKHEEDDEDD